MAFLDYPNWLRRILFGGKILRTVGSVNGIRSGLTTSSVKVHVTRRKEDSARPFVTLEVTGKTLLSFQMTLITLSADSAHLLSDLIQEASEVRPEAAA